MLKTRYRLAIISAFCAGLTGCASTIEPVTVSVTPEPVETAPVACRSTNDVQKIGDLERQLAKEQRQCANDKRRQEQALKESQKQNEDLQKKLDDAQKKLDALLTIDRDLRNRNRGR